MQGNLNAALEHAEQVVVFNPADANAWALQGYVYEQKGDKKEAKLFYEKSIELRP